MNDNDLIGPNGCIPYVNDPFQIPSVEYIHPLPGPTTLELAKALRDCFKATGGKVPTAPLDELIARYDFTIDFKIDVSVDEEQLEANRNIAVEAVSDIINASGLSEVEHTWQNLYSDKPTFICKCGDEFESHEALMKHTAKLNPTIETYELGRAGVAIERTAHENTLELLRRARDLLLRRQTSDEVESLLTDIGEQCPVLNEDDS